MNKFLLLGITSLWLVGLYGALFVLGYLVQRRRRFRWNQHELWHAPRVMTLLYLSSSVFCAGLALRLYLLPPPALSATILSVNAWGLDGGRWPIAVGWALLALLLAGQAVATALVGLRFGWNEAATARARLQSWDGSAPGTPMPLVQWLIIVSLLWIALFTFGPSLLEVGEMLIRELGLV